MSEQDFDEASPGRDYPAYGEPPRRPEIDSSWDRYIAPTLVFVIPYTLWRGGLPKNGCHGILPRVSAVSLGRW